jgi:hypothetical protein
VKTLTGFVLAVLWPALLFAQPAIAGAVHDASGAPLAGVSVEAAGPALIGTVRTAVTDDTGQYAIAGLPPGTFSVRFRLAGFSTVSRTGIVLTGTFVATVHATLEIGTHTENIRVTTPVVDLKSTTHQVVMTSDILDDVPTGRSLANLGGLIPGMTTVSARVQSDVGGTNNLQNQFLAIHGGRFSDQRIYVDGVTIRNLQSEGHATNFTPDMSSTQEVVIDVAGATAEEPLAGVRASYVPREGANEYSASVFLTGANGGFQGSNLTPGVAARGLTPDALKVTYDVNPAAGGPIVRGKAWFYAASRFQSNQAYVGGIFENRNAGNPTAWTYDPDRSRPGLFSISQQSVNTRLTWRPSARQKASFFVEKQWRSWDEGNVVRAPEAFSRFRFSRNQIAVATWSATLSDRLLVEARAAYHAEAWTNIGGDDLLANNRSLIPVLEQAGAFPGLMYRGKNGIYTGQSAPFIRIGGVSASYVTGAHAMKAGFDVVGGSNTNPNTFNDSGLQYRLNNGVPNQVTEFATPFTLAWQVTELGAYAQDRWTLRRLTLNAGLRFDHFGTSFPEQHLGPATLFPARDLTFAPADWFSLNDVSPRLGAAFDLSGRGRTVVKATAGRYVVALSPMIGNPVANVPLSVTRPWNDENHDFVVDCSLTNAGVNGECGAMSDANFGTAQPSVAYDPSILRGWNVRPYDWEFSAAIQHELRPRVAVSAAYFRRVYGNFMVQDNRAASAADYTAFSVAAPVDGRLPGGGGFTVDGLYDLNPDKRGAVDNYVTSANQYGRQIEHWNGLDAGVAVTLSRLLVRGGVSAGRTSADLCDVAAQLPEVLGTATMTVGGRSIPWSLSQCHMDSAILTQAKVMARYVVPRLDLQLAGTLQSAPGPELQANYVAPNAVVQPSLGRPLSGGANTTVTLIAPGSVYGDRVNQLDVRVGKLLRFRGSRTAINLDVYNLLNASPITALNLNYAGSGAGWLQPQAILPARLFKVSAHFEF